jgi:predicted nuclease with RNAse H fold
LPVSFLGGLTFRALVLVPKLQRVLPHAAIIEVFPTAALRLLGIRPVERGVKRAAKTSEAARRATQEGLACSVAGIPPVADGLLGADLLDALAAALTGVAYSRKEFVAVGEANEGQIILPDTAFVQRVRAIAPTVGDEE